MRPMCLCGVREEKVSAYAQDRTCTGLVLKVRVEAAEGRGCILPVQKLFSGFASRLGPRAQLIQEH